MMLQHAVNSRCGVVCRPWKTWSWGFVVGVILLLRVDGGEGFSLGMYGTHWYPWMRGNREGGDLNIYQVTPERDVEEVLEVLKAAQRNRIKVILDMLFYTSKQQRAAERGAAGLRSLEFYEGLFSRVLDHLGELPVEGVTIEEENVYWGGRAQFLGDLYRRLKARYNGIEFYQWYSSSRTVNIPGDTWPGLPSDGWVIDPYQLKGLGYYRLVKGMMALGKPVVGVVWASPNWQSAAGERKWNPDWWNTEGWKTFYWQLSVNGHFNVPTAFFAFWLSAREKGRLVPLWHSESHCAQEFLRQLVQRTFPMMRSTAVLPLKVPATRPKWIPALCAG